MSLVDRDCVILDGSCTCAKPFEDCKYIEVPLGNTSKKVNKAYAHDIMKSFKLIEKDT